MIQLIRAFAPKRNTSSDNRFAKKEGGIKEEQENRVSLGGNLTFTEKGSRVYN